MPLVLTMMLAMVLAALGSAMAIGTTAETMIAAAYRDGTSLLYAADAAAEFAIDELARSDWAAVLDTGELSTFVDGTSPDAESLEGPSGYQIYAYGRFGDMLGRSAGVADPYVIVWIADVTEPPADAAGSGRTVAFLATALGKGGGRRSVGLTARLASSDEEVSVERLSWMQEP